MHSGTWVHYWKNWPHAMCTRVCLASMCHCDVPLWRATVTFHCDAPLWRATVMCQMASSSADGHSQKLSWLVGTLIFFISLLRSHSQKTHPNGLQANEFNIWEACYQCTPGFFKPKMRNYSGMCCRKFYVYILLRSFAWATKSTLVTSWCVIFKFDVSFALDRGTIGSLSIFHIHK